MNIKTEPAAWDDRPVDVSNEVNFIWSVASFLYSVSYKDTDHCNVILKGAL